MNKPISSTSCQSGCWILAAASGLVVLAVCLFLIDMGILASIFMGAVVFIVVGLLLGWIFCSELKPLVQPNDTSAAPSAPEPAPVSEPAPATAPVAQAPKAEAPEVEAVEDAVRPEALSGARNGGADDLKMMKGVGPKLEIMLNELGFYHFDQIAGWSAAEVAWVNDNLTGFKGRVSRDNWVEQARKLASGQETEFSKRVSDGDVY
jgi:predicted flap endonuclease-1-like 5' DNA nuclease